MGQTGLVKRAEPEAIDAVARSYEWRPDRAPDIDAIRRLPVDSLTLAELLDERRVGLKAPKEWSGEELAARLDRSVEEVADSLGPLVALGLLHICQVVEGDGYRHLFSLQPKLWIRQDPEYDALMGALSERVSAPLQAGTRQRLSPLAARATARPSASAEEPGEPRLSALSESGPTPVPVSDPELER